MANLWEIKWEIVELIEDINEKRVSEICTKAYVNILSKPIINHLCYHRKNRPLTVQAKTSILPSLKTHCPSHKTPKTSKNRLHLRQLTSPFSPRMSTLLLKNQSILSFTFILTMIALFRWSRNNSRVSIWQKKSCSVTRSWSSPKSENSERLKWPHRKSPRNAKERGSRSDNESYFILILSIYFLGQVFRNQPLHSQFNRFNTVSWSLGNFLNSLVLLLSFEDPNNLRLDNDIMFLLDFLLDLHLSLWWREVFSVISGEIPLEIL